MALFDNINSRYGTQSMKHGGTYAADAAAGGFNRKELRGLKRQAKRGTLTQRERARLNYLTKTRKGRVGRGLLSGLAGAGTVLGGLALARKLGGGEGGGLGLMEAIKAKLHDRKVRKAEDEQWNRRDLGIQQELADDNLASILEGTQDREERPDAGEIDAMANLEGLSDIDLEEEGDIAGEKTGEQLGQEALDAKTELGRRMREEGEAYTQMELGRHSNMQEPSEMDLLGEHGVIPEGAEGAGVDVSALLRALEGAEGPGELPSGGLKPRLTSDNPHIQERMNQHMELEGGFEPDISEQGTSIDMPSGPVRTTGPRANIGMRVNPGKQKRDLIRQYMNNRYR